MKNYAISEIVGTVLLLGVTVAVFSLAYYTILSKETQPSIELNATITGGIIDKYIILTHQGGESISLKNTQITIVVDEQSITNFTHKDFNNNGFWDIGETLTYQHDGLSGLDVQVKVVNLQTNQLLYLATLQDDN